MNKTNIEFSQDGDEITHSVYREFYFTRSLSVSSDETYVIVPNIPLFGLIKKLSNSDSYTKSAARSLLEGYKGGIISESFSHWLNLQESCQITTLSTIDLNRRCSVWQYGLWEFSNGGYKIRNTINTYSKEIIEF